MSRFAFIAALSCTAPAFADTAYFAAIPDLPVAPGMSESPGPFLAAFSSTSGELILANARGSATPVAVERFYSDSLSALGWAYTPGPRNDGMTFVRGRERLILHIEPRDGGTSLRVRLIARPAPSNAD
jgi:hypothetical protein